MTLLSGISVNRPLRERRTEGDSLMERAEKGLWQAMGLENFS